MPRDSSAAQSSPGVCLASDPTQSYGHEQVKTKEKIRKTMTSIGKANQNLGKTMEDT